MKTFIESWAKQVVQHRLLIIVAWVILLVAAGYAGRNIQFDHTIERNFSADDPKVTDFNQLLHLFGDNEYLVVGVSAPEGQDVFNAKTLEIVDALTLFLERQEAVTQVRSLTKYQYILGDGDDLLVEDLFPNQSAENTNPAQRDAAREIIRNEALAMETLITPALTETRIAARIQYRKESPAHKVELVKALYAFVDSQGYTGQGHRIRFGGQPVFDEQFETRNKSDSSLLYPLMAIIMIAILWISFRSWFVTLMPWTVIIAAIGVLTGVQGVLGYPHSAVDQALVPTLIIIGIGITMHLILAFISLQKTTQTSPAAVIQTIKKLFMPSFFTSATTSIGFCTLAVTDIIPVKEMAILGAIGPVLLFLLSFSLLPALLSYRKAVVTEQTKSSVADWVSGKFQYLPEMVYRNTKSILWISGLLFIGTGAALTTIKVDTNFVEYFKENNPARQDMLYFDEHFNGAMTMEVIIDSGAENGIKNPEFLQRVDSLEHYLEARDSTAKILSVLDYVKEVNQSIHEENTDYYRLPSSANETAQLLFLYENAGPEEDLSDMRDFDNRYLRLTVPMVNMPASQMQQELAIINAELERNFSGLNVTLTGVKLLFQAQDVYTSEGMVKSFVLSLIIISLFFFVLFRSFKLGLYCMIPSVLPIIMVGAATGLLGIPLDLGTMIVGAMTMGLAVDDSIHVVSRYAQAKQDGLDTLAAVKITMKESGTAVVFSSVVLVLGFAILTLGSFVPIVYVGLFSAAIMALALLGDLLLLPALIFALDRDRGMQEAGLSVSNTGNTTGTNTASNLTTVAILGIGMMLGVFHSAPGHAQTAASEQGALTGYEIMAKVDARDEGTSSIATSTMVLIDKKERQRSRQLKQYAKEYEDTQKYMAHFLTPADLKDTVYINYDWRQSGTEDDSWLYLPALNKVKRISSEDRSGAFLGSDFSYADISGFELEWYDYTLLKDSDIVDGHDCWVIEYQAKEQFKDKVLSTTGDLKTQTWVRKDIFFQVKSKIWKARGDKIKYFIASNVEQIDGIWTAKKMQMITTKNDQREHSSVFVIQDIHYGGEVRDDIFVPDNMQRSLVTN